MELKPCPRCGSRDRRSFKDDKRTIKLCLDCLEAVWLEPGQEEYSSPGEAMLKKKLLEHYKWLFHRSHKDGIDMDNITIYHMLKVAVYSMGIDADAWLEEQETTQKEVTHDD